MSCAFTCSICNELSWLFLLVLMYYIMHWTLNYCERFLMNLKKVHFPDNELHEQLKVSDSCILGQEESQVMKYEVVIQFSI